MNDPILFDPYVRRAAIEGVVDGDTIDVVIDMGFRNMTRQRLRFQDVDTPEKNPRKEGRSEASLAAERAAAKQAETFTYEWVNILDGHTIDGDLKWPFTIRTDKDKTTLDRYIATVYRHGDPISLNQALINAGHEKNMEDYGP